MDLEKVRQKLSEIDEEAQTQEPAAQAEEKPGFWALLTDPAVYQKGQELSNKSAIESNEAAGNIISDTAEDISEAVSRIPDAYGRLMAQEQAITAAYNPVKLEIANATGDYSEQQQAVEGFEKEGSRFGQTLWEAAGAPTRAIRERIGVVEDDAAESGSESAQRMRDTSTFIDYFMSDEQKLSKARQIEALTGIPADATLADTQAMKSALEVYDYAEKQKAVLGDAPWSMDAVWQEYPELKNIADMSPQDAALALHQIDAVRRTHGIIDSWQTMLEYGNKELEYGNLQYKIMQGKADENDMARAAELEEQLKSQKKSLPSVFDDPLAAIVGGVAASTPMMYQSFMEAGQDAAAWMLAASAAGAGAGSVLPGVGTAAGALAGSATGVTRFAYLFLSNLARYSSGASFIRTMGESGAKLGMLEGMRRPTVGQDYAEYREMKDAEGHPLLTDEQAKDYATVAGTLNAGIEMANFGVALRALKGAPHTHKMITDIIKGATERQTAQESLRLFAMDRGADILKVTASEAGEEGLQSISDDIVHNKIEADTGDTSNGIYSFRDIAARGLQSSIEALPASFGFGVLSGFGGTVTGGIGKNIAMRDRARFEARYSKEERETLMGSSMYEQLQQAVAQSNVKEENKDIQRKVIRQQLANTKFSTVYVDTETALEKETGMDDLKAVAQAANISDEDLQTAIDEKGTLTVPGEQFAQAASSPDLLESVSFSPEADSIARMRKDAKTTLAAMEEREKASISRQMNLQNAILDEYYPEKNGDVKAKARREALQAIMLQNPENPAQGWNDVRKEYRTQLDEILAPALRALREGMGEDGPYTEMEKAEWYKNFYQTFGRKPTEQELGDMAIALTTGEEGAPKIEGFIPTTKEEADRLAAMKPAIEDLQKKITTIDDIKQEARQLNGVEMELTEGLSKDGFHVYRTVMHQLRDVGGAPARAARMDAILFARHADIVADVISKKTGKKYTALDYMRERYGLETGEGAQPLSSESLKQAMRDGLNLDEKVPVLDIDAMETVSKGDLADLIRSMVGDEPVPTRDFMALVGIPEDRYGQRHIIFNKSTRSSHGARILTRRVIKNFREIISHASIIEITPNRKINALSETPSKRKSAQRRKNGVKEYYRLMLPVAHNGNIETVVITAENTGKEVRVGKQSISIYEIGYAKKNASFPASPASSREQMSMARETGIPSEITIREMLSGVKNADGNSYLSFNQEKNRGAKGYITPYSDGRRVITLLEEADESTFLHEMSHMFLMDLEDLAQIDEVSKKELELVDAWANWEKGAAKEYKGTPWEREFRKREQGIIDAEVAGDHDTADRLKRQWRQERFARAFELYLREGKAPARGLRAVFRKFKQFLRVIYQAFAGDGGRASLPVQRVMARMIATEDEIEEMSLDDRYKDVTKAGGEKLLDEDDAKTYARWREESIAEAKEKLMKTVMKDLTEKKEREFKERVARERNRKSDELQNEPVYLATQAISASGGDETIVKNWYGSIEEYQEEVSKVPPIEEALDAYMEQYTRALDEELIQSHFSEEAVRAAMESSEYADKLQSLISTAFAKKQALIRTITTKTQHAMQSVEDKLTALPEDVDLKVDKTDKAVRDIMKAINRLRFSTRWKAEDYATIENMIRAATKEDIRNELMKLKAAKDADKENEKAVMEANEGRLKVYRDIADRAMKTKTVAEIIDVCHYKNEQRRLAVRVQQMIKVKRWDMAMQAQQQMAFAAAMEKRAAKAREDIMRRLDRIKKQLKARSVRLPKDERYWHRHLAYILRITKTDAKEPESGHVTLQELFTNMEQSLDIQGAPEGIFELAAQGDDFRGWSSLKYDELKQALDALTMIYTTGRDKFRMKTIGGKDIEEVVDEICAGGGDADLIRTQEKKVEENRGGLGYNDWLAKVPGIGRLIAQQGQGFLAAMMKPEEILRALGPAAHRYLYGIYEKAAQEEGARIEQEYKALKDILSGYSHSEKRAWKEKKYTFTTGAGKELWSKENIICAALNLGTETNIQRLAGGLDVEARDIRAFIEEHMTKKDWMLVQDLWDYISSYWSETVAVEEKLNGVALEKVKAVPFDATLPDGATLHMKGGYYPVRFNAEKSGKAAEQEINAAAAGAMSGAQVLGTRRSFTKSRSEHDVRRPLLLEFSVIPKHLQDVIHNITYRVPARDVYRLVSSRKVEEYVAGTLGREYYDVLKEWATDVWNVLPGADTIAERKVDRIFGALRRNSVMAIMGYRIWPVIENVSNIGPVMDRLGAANGLAAVADFYAHYSEAKKLLYKSIFMRNRINSMDRDIGQQEGMFQADARPFEVIRSHAYDLMLYSDLALSAPLWVRAYKDAYTEMVAEVKRENEVNIQAVLKAQEDLETIRARILDLSRNVSDIKKHLDVRRHGTAEDIEAAKQSPFAVRTEDDLRAEAAGNAAEAKELEKKRYEAEVKLQKATERDVLTDEEVLKEAERRAIAQADAAIRDTFGSGQTQDLSSIQRQRGELYKLMTTFYSFFNTQFNAIFAAYRHGKFGARVEGTITRWAPFARAVFYRLVVMSLIGSMLKFALGVDGSDDKDKYRKVKNPETGKDERVEIPVFERFLHIFGNNLLSTATGSFVGVRDIANLAITYLFDGTTYGRGINPISTAFKPFEELGKTVDLLARKGKKDLEIEEQHAKKRKTQEERLKKLRGKSRQEYLKKLAEEEKYKHPDQHITYSEIARHGLNAVSTLTAAHTGITNTLVDAVTGTMQYMNDADNRYEGGWNIVWSAVFDKKPVEREILQKPEPASKNKKKKKKEK